MKFSRFFNLFLTEDPSDFFISFLNGTFDHKKKLFENWREMAEDPPFNAWKSERFLKVWASIKNHQIMFYHFLCTFLLEHVVKNTSNF